MSMKLAEVDAGVKKNMGVLLAIVLAIEDQTASGRFSESAASYTAFLPFAT
jgi:hypothetical protein